MSGGEAGETDFELSVEGALKDEALLPARTMLKQALKTMEGALQDKIGDLAEPRLKQAMGIVLQEVRKEMKRENQLGRG